MERSSSSPPLDENTANTGEVDDIEVVLKGSDLEKMLSALGEHIDNDFDVFSPSVEKERGQSVPPFSVFNVSKKLEPTGVAEFIALKQLLLSSGLMLDEDIAFLVNDSPDHLVTQFFLERFAKFSLPGCCAMSMLSFYRLVRSFKWPDLLFIVTTFGSTMFLAYRMYRSSRLKSGLKKLLTEMTKVCQFLKKTAITIKEAKANVDTKVVVLSLRKTNAELLDRYYAQVKADIKANYFAFLTCIVNFIDITRDATKRILCAGASVYTSKLFYIALCSNEELGITAIDSDFCRGGDISISKLEVLCDQYILMQSEYLRVLGMWLSSPENVKPEDVSSNILLHCERLSKLLEGAQQTFCEGLFARHPENKIPRAKSRDMILTQMNSAITSLLCEAYNLKNYINDKDHLTSDDSPYLELSLCNLESCFSDCSKLMQGACSILQRQKSDKCHPTANQPTLSAQIQNSSVTKTGVEVGHSDFSVMGEDKVYLCITDIDELSHLDYKEFDEETPSYPNSLMSELKGVLEEKRLEFKQRESDAVKSSKLEDVEEQFDLIVLNKPLEQRSVEQGNPCCSSATESAQHVASALPHHGDSCLQTTESSLQNAGEHLTSFSLTKSIAASAARTSNLWNCQIEEFFGEEETITESD